MKTLQDKRKTTAHRLAIVEGHLRKVRRMLDEGAYCIDIIHQSRAIQQALRKFDEQVLQHHLRTCVARDMRDTRGGAAEKTIAELMQVFDRL
ncbi:MAG: metal-sensing transcriptional repressor [Candidatus Kerfeldbacteria bacterium]|nr:metal-sensing transcriptional repressor [Candidatus Kerfeldbacteria bacterium]